MFFFGALSTKLTGSSHKGKLHAIACGRPSSKSPYTRSEALTNEVGRSHKR
jgi:hypothetical protein